MNNKIIIFGLGETAELAYEYFTHDSQYEVMAFVGDSKYIKTQYLCGLPVYDIENIENFSLQMNMVPLLQPLPDT